MKIDRLVLKDIWGPWLFGVGLFTALLMAATYLGRVAGFIVDGAPPFLVLELFGLLMPAMLVKTFSMSVLLATLLGFGRLSSDSEIIALKAGGASVYRMVAPVFVFSVLIAIVTFAFNEKFVPAATLRSKQITDEIVGSAKVKINEPISRTEVENDKLVAGIIAADVSPANRLLEGVTMVAYDDKEHQAFVMTADEMHFNGKDDWYVTGHVKIFSTDGTQIISVPDRVWPDQMPKVKPSFDQLTAVQDDDFDSQTMAQLGEAIARHKRMRDKKESVLHNYEYGYWNKISIPLAALTFGVLGAVLGIRNARTGTAAGFALAIAIIFFYVTVGNFMNVWALGGVIPAWAASFAPLAVGAVVSGVIMWRRNS